MQQCKRKWGQKTDSVMMVEEMETICSVFLCVSMIGCRFFVRLSFAVSLQCVLSIPTDLTVPSEKPTNNMCF